MLELTKEEVVSRLRASCSETTQRSWSRLHGVSEQYVSDVLLGRRDPGSSILAALGLIKIERYVAGPKSRS